MSDAKPKNDLPTASDLEERVRGVRHRYDALAPGDRAILRRCKTPEDIQLEGAYWRIASNDHSAWLPAVVLLFPEAPQARGQHVFSLGRFLRAKLPKNEESRSLRFRRLAQCDARDELVHRLRSLLRLTSNNTAPVDWGVLGRDILWFGDAVKRRWTQDFFAPSAADA